jgi:ferric-dicitrate binding protein FerR (iron transport regulator)
MNQVNTERERDLGQLADLVSDELTPDEVAHVRERVEHDDRFRALAAPVLAAWVVGRAESSTSDEDAHAALVERMAAIDRARAARTSGHRRRRWAGGAVVGLASAALFYVTLANVPPGRRLLARVVGVPADFTITTAVGEERSIPLRDGSRVTIEPDTRLSYTASFLDPAQLVTLQGAATFDVAPQHFGTFRVAAGRVFAQVQGTRFTVRAYAGEPEASVTVTRGRVKVAGPDLRDVDVDSGFVAQVVGRHVVVKPIGVEGQISWDGQKLWFEHVPLAAVAAELRHWYGIQIRLADSSLLNRIVTTAIPGTQAKGLAALSAAVNARVDRTRDAVLLYGANR